MTYRTVQALALEARIAQLERTRQTVDEILADIAQLDSREGVELSARLVQELIKGWRT